MLPRTMTVVVPKPFPDEAGEGLDVTLIDTRGMDGSVESRADLQKFLRDPRAAIILCGSFKDAPGKPCALCCGPWQAMRNCAKPSHTPY
ncbi:MAG: hypothetical protein ACRER2_06820 [Methylococcales bacterium]